MKSVHRFLLAGALLAIPSLAPAANYQLLGWNNLGMHCMDSDYSVFSILPPYNTVEAQLVAGGRLVTNGAGYAVTYEAVADPGGSINRTAQGKGNFYEFSEALYGARLTVDQGLLAWPMPGPANVPQAMLFESTNRPAPGVATRVNWFRAEGIPITPIDDAGRKNPYPMMRLIARNGAGTALATNNVVLPVSDEMDCRACHASGTGPDAQPADGWVWSDSPERDYRLNILRLHDERQFAGAGDVYRSALAARGFSNLGLYRGAVADGKPVLCATCHASEALGTGSYSNIPPLTASVHMRHASVIDPDLGITLNNSSHRAACYRCHPGSATRCLRGAMGGAIAANGSMAMQCQSCHGTMSQVGASDRVGWFMEPKCQSCHTGTAVSNAGQIRYLTVFEPGGGERTPADPIFATTPNTPAPGLSLYRFSHGHGGLQCSACHGSTHAEFPSTHANDNVRNQQIQQHAGVTVECLACHATMPVSAVSATGGPHGLHPLGQAWADTHGDLLEANPALRAGCANCHGGSGTGTVLSQAKTTRIIPTKDNKYGTVTYWRGRNVSCYDCHNGPNSTDPTLHPQPLAQDVAASTVGGTPVILTLSAAGTPPLTYRIVNQPAHGAVGLNQNQARYFPEPGFTGTDSFAFAVWNGWVDSTLGTATVTVTPGPSALEVAVLTPLRMPAGWPVPFTALLTRSNTVADATFDWQFGDGSQASGASVAHAYSTPGNYQWTLQVTAGGTTASTQGTILIDTPMVVDIGQALDSVTLAWANGNYDVVLETTPALTARSAWSPAGTPPVYGTQKVTATVPKADTARFFRLRKVR